MATLNPFQSYCTYPCGICLNSFPTPKEADRCRESHHDQALKQLHEEMVSKKKQLVSSSETSIEDTLKERGKRYGEFEGHAEISQALQSVMRAAEKWEKLKPDQKEALTMIAHKIGRILNGDPDYHDSWHDIVGYTKLVADRILKESK